GGCSWRGGAELLTAGSDGPAALWPMLERTAAAVERALDSGVIPVTGVDGAPPLTDALGLPDLLDIPAHAACEFCDHDALCGRRRSEEHTSELQSLTNLVCRLLLDKQKTHHD